MQTMREFLTAENVRLAAAMDACRTTLVACQGSIEANNRLLAKLDADEAMVPKPAPTPPKHSRKS